MNKYFSKALFIENFKRFWSISAVGTILYFFTDIYMLINEGFSEEYYHYYSVRNILTNNVNIIWLCILPIISALCVFSYLEKTNSCNVMHAQPYSRTSLFITNVVSGYVIAVIPSIITFVELLFLQKPLIGPDTEYSFINGNYVVKNPVTDYYTTGNCLLMLVTALVCIFVIYSICVLANILTGNIILAFLTSVGANCVVQFIWLGIILLCDEILYGFVDTASMYDAIVQFHPITAISSGASAYGTVLLERWPLFLLGSCAFLIIAYLHYTRRKLEKCGESYVFEWCNVFVGFVFVYMPFLLFKTGFGMDYFGTFIAVFISFIIGQMIIRKTFRLVNMKTVKNGILYAVMLAVLIGAIIFDVTGYENRVPDVSKIESVTVNMPGEYSKNQYTYGMAGTVYDEEGIGYVTDIHKAILTRNLDWKDYDDYDYNDYGSVSLNYHLKNGKTLVRRYYIKSSELYKNESYQKLKGSISISNPITNLLSLDKNKIEILELEAHENGSRYEYTDLIKYADQIGAEKLIDVIAAEYRNTNVPASNNFINYYVSFRYTYTVESSSEHDVMSEYLKNTHGYDYEVMINSSGKTKTYSAFFNISFNDTVGILDEFIKPVESDTEYMILLARYYEDLFTYDRDGVYGLVKQFNAASGNIRINPHAIIIHDDEIAKSLININASDTGAETFYGAVYRMNESTSQYELVSTMFDNTEILAKYSPSIYDEFMSQMYWR